MSTRGSEQERNAGVYCRISKWDGDGESLGVQRQETDCRIEAGRRRGWRVVDVYTDDDKSAFSGNKRPSYVRLCDDIKNGVIDAVIVWDADRLHRSPRELEDFVTLIEATGTMVVSVSGGEYDLETADGRFKARIMGAVARKESEDKSRRLARKHVELASNGKPNGGRRATGYHRDGITPATPESFPCDHHNADTCTAKPTEAAMVAELITRVARGETMTAIGDDLNRRGLTTSAGSPWNVWTVRRVALNPRYAGLRVHRGEIVGKADWNGLIDETTWRRAVALLNAPDRPQRRSPRRYLLTGGLIVCGRCLAEGRTIPMRSKQTHGPAGPVPTYVCQPRRNGGCGGVSAKAEPVEELVATAVIEIVESTKFAKSMSSRKGGDRKAASEVNKLRRELDELEQAKIAKAINLREYIKFRDATQVELDAALARMGSDTTEGAVGRFAGRAGVLRAWWDNPATTLDQRQAVVRGVVERVVIEPVGKATRKRFDSDRVRIERVI